MRRTLHTLLSLLIIFNLSLATAEARPEWPKDITVQSEAGIVMDMDSGAVIFAQNIHVLKSPSSITKLLTALVVIEYAEDLDSELTFSWDAVRFVEEGSGNKLLLEPGDTMTVREALIAMILQSSNQAANALAEYTAGSRSGFAELMNKKAAKLGCVDGSRFTDPAGSSDGGQKVSAYDMALIACAVFRNPEALVICSAREGAITSTASHPKGISFTTEHRLVKDNGNPDSDYYYPPAKAGKTGYSSQAGQTLVTYGEQDGRRLVAVTLNSREMTHYSDTKRILEFAFTQFKNVSVADHETEYVTGSAAVSIGAETCLPSQLEMEKGAVITLPRQARFSDAKKRLDANRSEKYPEGATARLDYSYNGRKIGSAWIYRKSSSLK